MSCGGPRNMMSCKIPFPDNLGEVAGRDTSTQGSIQGVIKRTNRTPLIRNLSARFPQTFCRLLLLICIRNATESQLLLEYTNDMICQPPHIEERQLGPFRNLGLIKCQ